MKVVANSIVGAVALIASGLASATVIQFDGIFTPNTSGPNQGNVSSFLEESRNSYVEGGYTIRGLGTGVVGGTVASMIDGSDDGACLAGLNCPDNNDSSYLGTQNGAYFYVDKTSGPNRFNVVSLDLAYVSPAPVGRAYGVQLIGTTTTGTTVYSSYFRLTEDFQTFIPSAVFSGYDLTRMWVRGGNCSTTMTGCVQARTGANNVGALAFGVDNISLIPEPSTPALWAAGIFLMAMIGRYKRRSER